MSLAESQLRQHIQYEMGQIGRLIDECMALTYKLATLIGAQRREGDAPDEEVSKLVGQLALDIKGLHDTAASCEAAIDAAWLDRQPADHDFVLGALDRIVSLSEGAQSLAHKLRELLPSSSTAAFDQLDELLKRLASLRTHVEELEELAQTLETYGQAAEQAAPLESSATLSCPSCHSRISIDDAFCPFCGRRMTAPTHSGAPHQARPSVAGSVQGQPTPPVSGYASAPSAAPMPMAMSQAPMPQAAESPAPVAPGAYRKPSLRERVIALFSKRSQAGSSDAQQPSPAPAMPPVAPPSSIYQQEAPQLSAVRFTAVAPRTFTRGSYSILDIVMFESGWEHAVEEVAAEHEESISTTSSGWTNAAWGTDVEVELSSPELGPLGTQSATWLGRYLRFSFPLKVPEGIAATQVLLQAVVRFDGVPATNLSFIASVEAMKQQLLEPVGSDIRSAFISYASTDRARVARIVQGMQTARPDLDVFFDVESLRAGQDWRQTLEREIARRDVLFLCWSREASASSWVDFEWRYALRNKGLASIEPVALEPPELCPPPAELSAKHFNDRLLYIINRDA